MFSIGSEELLKSVQTIFKNTRGALKAVELAKSVYYENLKKKYNCNDEFLKEKIDKIYHKFPGYGYRRITAQFHREGLKINAKVVRRVMKTHGLFAMSYKRRKVRTTQSDHGLRRFPNLIKKFKPQAVNQLWVTDLTYVSITNGFVYVNCIMDRFSRKVIGYALSKPGVGSVRGDLKNGSGGPESAPRVFPPLGPGGAIRLGCLRETSAGKSFPHQHVSQGKSL